MVYMKKIARTAGIVLISVVLLLGVASGLAYLYRDKIIGIAVNRINRNLGTPVDVGEISLNIFQHYPSLTLEFDRIKVKESKKITGIPLCSAGTIRMTFTPFMLFSGNYKIQSLIIENAVFNLAIDSSGEVNYHVFKNAGRGSEGTPHTFSLNRIVLKNISVNYTSFYSLNSIILLTPGLKATLRYGNNKIDAQVEGVVQSKRIFINGVDYLPGESTSLKSDFIYDIDKDVINFLNSSAEINGFTYLVNGMIGTTGDQDIDLKVESSKSDAKAITSLLPRKYRDYLKDYQSQGDVRFRAAVKGALNTDRNPLVDIQFSCARVSLFQPRYNKSLESISLTGRFTNGNERNFHTSVLEIKNLKAELEGKPISGSLIIRDFNRLMTDADISAGFNINTVLSLFPVKNIKSGNGEISLNLKFSGPLTSAGRPGTGNNLSASGDLTFIHAGFNTDFSERSVTGLDGTLHFNNADLAFENLDGAIGSSDFQISGFFRNIIPFILQGGQPVHIDADIDSRFLNLNELLQMRVGSPNSAGESRGYHLDLSPNLDIRLRCHARHVILKKFSARNVTSTMTVRNQRIMVDSARMYTMGGILNLSGTLVARDPINRDILADGHLDGIYIDSLFYVFDNFNQDFLVSRNLKGQINADVNTFMTLGRNMVLIPSSLLAFINISIVNGELNDFDPMQKLSKYVDSESLKHLKFSELRNDIQVKNHVITIPEMEIISNVSTIRVSGTQTFDQHIDYHFVVPLAQFNREDPDARFGAIEKDENGGMNIFLKMTGATDDYKLTYDTRAMKQKVIADFKREGHELKDLFKNKEHNDEKEKKVELNENEYFDQ